VTGSGDDLVPVSVRLGEVVPPEDPEDWTRPLTWVAALGMLAAPVVTFAWFVVAPPQQGEEALLATYAAAVLLAVGATLTGATQIGRARAWTATVATGLFAALAVIVVGVVMAGERQVGAASPTLAHAFAVAVAGLAGVAAAAIVAALTAAWRRPARFAIGATAATVVAVGTLSLLMQGVAGGG
jgi:hypothetical protein